jgi:spore coat polysaccharide biosynthesis predicted glycosyltransferase SpsG
LTAHGNKMSRASGTGPAQKVIGFRCDAGGTFGVGHLVRCIALAEELVRRHLNVVFLTDTSGSAWAEAQLESRGFAVLPAPVDPDHLAAVAESIQLSAVVLDGYHLSPNCGRQLHKKNITVLALVDSHFGAEQWADIYLDQNLGATQLAPIPSGSLMLCGLKYALLRNIIVDRVESVVCCQPEEVRDFEVENVTTPMKVLTFFGGTDPYGASEVIVPMIVSTGAPVAISAIVTGHQANDALKSLALNQYQSLQTMPPSDDLPFLISQSDLVVSAAGSSVWELCALGAAAAIVSVTANQDAGYEAVTQRGLVAPLGHLGELTRSPAAASAATAVLRELLTVSASRLRLAEHGHREIDGKGRERVADLLLARLPHVNG